ncbi:MAG: xanthine dehydrogenase family protein molybdopterin-binding subunit [Rhodospirillaceae bacterium]|jgi:2-furoyl-CoA dehydrogenase large subunit|nr:xanthine dehydrogenase family protein molybdopterin-binding subunit [Rhodospirillales bacterium]MBT3907162.1 xanthine dehydrogenase family protein molybdopterin-binding subunit [Rhodospirillaceae bacterium]MBT4700245.1 xanthine dehydrogenase family protein molybdopterin-binding subunit [Rhodospirillaceae bacterium]MBT5032920.1 xanthine dehydrogenase family protein molybdopterin-binding subunit [Rhodospirillaceae bacterium]MBT6219811.1 xanthine dehydrogenase family protein molybdopterin-bindi
MKSNLHYISQKRRVKEDKRFVSGTGNYVQDVVLPNMKHAAVLQSPYPNARILSIDKVEAEALPGVHIVLTGEELAEDINPIRLGLKLPEVKWYPLAVGTARYVGEWVAIVVADNPYIAEDALELIDVDYEPLDPIMDPEEAFEEKTRLVHPGHGSNVLYHGHFTWGEVDDDFAAADDTLSFRARWGRSSTVPIETFGALAQWDEGTEILDLWASIQMPNFVELLSSTLRYPLNNVRLHQDVDVGGSYGVKRGIKHSVLVGYLCRKLRVPVRLIEDRLVNMSSGDAHGPDRIFDTDVAFNKDGVIKSLKIRALDDAGAYPGRGPHQLAKPISAIVGPYKINSVDYEAISVTTNKTGQVPVRGFGQAPTNFMIETAVDKVARHLGMDRVEIRRRNLINHDEFPYQIPSGTKYDSGDYHAVLDKVIDKAKYDELVKRRDTARENGKWAGIGVTTCLEPSGGNNIFEYLMEPGAEITTYMEGCEVRVDPHGKITGIMGTTTSGQGHETLFSTILGEELEFDPDDIRIVHADSLNGPPTRSPVASRMAIMLGSSAAGAAQKIKDRAMKIAAFNLNRPVEDLEYSEGNVFVRGDPGQKLTWQEICFIAHRSYHKLPDGMEPGFHAEYVFQVPGGGKLPDERNRVQIYPCFSFQAHIPYVEIDPGTCKVEILNYVVGHDCGTVINPDIVRGMMIGGLAHGIGAALFEKFSYAPDGQFLTSTFADYLMPSVYEMPPVQDVEHCTPSPLTSHGQKGSGEGGYLGAPAAISSAINDALEPLGKSIHELPMRINKIHELITTESDT